MAETTEAPVIALAKPTRNPRGGWYKPVRPGPPRRHLLAVAGVVALGSLLWLTLVVDGARGIGGNGKEITRTIEVASDGKLSGPTVRNERGSSFAGRAGTEYYVARGSVQLPGDADLMHIALELPFAVRAPEVAFRARTPAAVVELERDSDDAPFVDIRRITSGTVTVDVLIAIPIEGLSVDGSDEADLPNLDTVTRPYDANVVDEGASGRRLAWLRENALALIAAIVAAGLALPFFITRRLGRSWYGGVPRDVDTTPPAGPPSNLRALEAASFTRGARGLNVAHAFAGHVLELVATERLKLRRTFDPRLGEGSVLGIATAVQTDADPSDDPRHELDHAALELLRAMANEDGDSVQVPDAPNYLADALGDRASRLNGARAQWRTALQRLEDRLEVVEHPRWQISAVLGGISAVIALVALGVAVLTDLNGTSALAWLVVIGALGPAGIFGLFAHEQRTWRRVRANRRTARMAWVAWRAQLDLAASDGKFVELRNLPYAAATGAAEGIVSRLAGPTAVGMEAATPRLLDGLHAVATGQGATK